MKVIHLLLTGGMGGIETLTLNIVRNSQHENTVWCLFQGGAIAEQMDDLGMKIVIANTPRYYWKRKIKEFIDYCKEERIDVVVNHMDSPVACAHVMALKKAVPHIKILGYLHNDVREMTASWKNRLGYLPFIKAMHRCCDKVVAISQFVKMAGMEAYGLSEEKIELIYNGVDLERFSGEGYRPDKTIMELIFVGRLIPEKGVHLLLEALARVPKELPVHAQIVGGGPEFERLQMLVDELEIRDKIDFLGMRADIPQLLVQADYFVHPAICQEGFGITLIEAMACGKPCIAFEGGAVPEIIDNGVNGYIVAMEDIQQLADTIIKLYEEYKSERYREMSRLALVSVRKYDIRNMVFGLESLYQKDGLD